MSEDVEDLFDVLGNSKIKVHIEKRILDIIHKGNASDDLISRRPIRELIQNADDAFSDRIHIKFDKDGLTFQNDGLGLEVYNDADGIRRGTYDAISAINDENKEDDLFSSGTFGTGFRSAHLFSDQAQIHGKLDFFGTNIYYQGICSAYTDEITNIRSKDYNEAIRKGIIITKYRTNSERPSRKRSLLGNPDGTSDFTTKLQDAEKRCGITFYWPWRKVARNKKWSAMTWNPQRIEKTSKDCLELIPEVIIGCRWIREVVLTVDLPGIKLTNAWVKDFNIHEFLEKSELTKGSIINYQSTKVFSDPMIMNISNLKEISSSNFSIFTYLDKDLISQAHEARLLPNCMIIIPDGNYKHRMQTYTPISLTIDSGNNFSPLAFVPPHESRTMINLKESLETSKIIWASHAMNIFSAKLLPQLFDYKIKELHEGKISPNDFLSLIARNRPKRWFGIDNDILDIKNLEIQQSWQDYTEYVSVSRIFPDSSSQDFVTSDNIIKLNVEGVKTNQILTKLIEIIGMPVLSTEQLEILNLWSDEDWGIDNPLKKMTPISSPKELRDFLDSSGNKLTLEILGEELVKDLINLLYINPEGIWDSADSKLIPIIPDAEGKLWPLRDSDGNSHFFSKSEDFSSLIPTSRIIHPKFIDFCSSLDFPSPLPIELAKLVDESSKQRPDEFGNLQNHPNLHRQVSKALLEITKSDNFNLKTIHQYNFIPCKQGKLIFVRRPNHIGEDLVWQVTSKFPARNWGNHTYRDFIFADLPDYRKNKIKLDPIIENKLVWLELHKDFHEDVTDIRNALFIHNVTATTPFVGLIRALIFAEKGELSTLEPVSIFHKYEDGEWELERWIGKKMSKKQIDSCLSSVLKLLSGKDTISGGWGASSTNIPSLYLLKDNSGEWSKVGDLCLELPENLSKLFNRRTIHDEHKNLLNRQLLVQGMSKSLNNSGGLGVPERITEDVILAKLNSLDIHQGNQRSKILEMMLLSKNRWEINELSSIDWIPRIDGEFSSGEEILLSTDNVVQYFGDNHPWYFKTDIDLSDKNILSRSKELKLMSDTNDANLLLSCLLGPDNVWSGLEGIEILQKLSKLFTRDNNLEVPDKRIGRLPDEQGNWHDDSWLVSDDLIDDYRTIFSEERNIVSTTQIGGKKISEMAKAWILPRICGPTVDQLIDKLAYYTDMIGEVEINKLHSLWKLIYKHYEESPSSFPEIGFHESAEFLFPINNKIINLEELIICDESDIEIFESPDIDILTYLDSNHHLSSILEDYFNVVNLDNIKLNDVIKCKRVVNNSKFSDLSIQRYWVILSCCRRLKEYIGEEIWLYRTSENYNFTVAKPSISSSRKALIPMESDSSDEVIRMINEKLPLFWLPRSGVIQSRIYQELKNLPGIPFIDVISRPKNVGAKNLNKEDWPLLTKATQQVLDALIILGKNRYESIRNIQVSKTKQKIPSKLYASSSPGSKEVFWKESIKSEPMILDFDYDNNMANLIISVHNSSLLEDLMISEIIGKQLSKDESIVHRLISTNESHWPNIDPLLETQEWQLFNRDLIGDEIRQEASRKMSAWYGQCQICPRQTPSDRQGGFLESTVAIFRQKGGRYYSDSIPNHKGNFMYLCPNHRELYSRSKENKLFWIPILDQAIQELNKNPTKEKANELCNNLLSTEGKLMLKIMTFEKVKPGEPAKENEWNVTWHKNHASGFKDAITQYLMSHVR